MVISVSVPLPHVRPGHDPFTAGRLDTLLHEWADEDREEAEEVGRRFVEQIRLTAPDRHVEAHIVRGDVNPTVFDVRGDIAPAIFQQADAFDASLVVVGSRERSGLTRRFGLGSVSRKVIRQTQSAVLVVRA